METASRPLLPSISTLDTNTAHPASAMPALTASHPVSTAPHLPSPFSASPTASSARLKSAHQPVRSPRLHARDDIKEEPRPPTYRSPRPARQSLPSLHEALAEAKQIDQCPQYASEPDRVAAPRSAQYSSDASHAPPPGHAYAPVAPQTNLPTLAMTSPHPASYPVDVSSQQSRTISPPPPPTAPQSHPHYSAPHQLYTHQPRHYSYVASQPVYQNPTPFASSPHHNMPPPPPPPPVPEPNALSSVHRSPYEDTGSRSDYRKKHSGSDSTRKEALPYAAAGSRRFGESVKRHLEHYEWEKGLRDVSQRTHQLVAFAEHYRRQSQPNQRPGPVPGPIPSPAEIDSMVQQSQSITDSLHMMREYVLQQHSPVSPVAQEIYRKSPKRSAESEQASDDKAGNGPLSGPDAKKRRGRAAAPGRCHSCNRAETPEWRRGPDGARTLCNACGLHYAKLTRKLSAGKASSGMLQPKAIKQPSSAL